MVNADSQNTASAAPVCDGGTATLTAMWKKSQDHEMRPLQPYEAGECDMTADQRNSDGPGCPPSPEKDGSARARAGAEATPEAAEPSQENIAQQNYHPNVQNCTVAPMDSEKVRLPCAEFMGTCITITPPLHHQQQHQAHTKISLFFPVVFRLIKNESEPARHLNKLSLLKSCLQRMLTLRQPRNKSAQLQSG